MQVLQGASSRYISVRPAQGGACCAAVSQRTSAVVHRSESVPDLPELSLCASRSRLVLDVVDSQQAVARGWPEVPRTSQSVLPGIRARQWPNSASARLRTVARKCTKLHPIWPERSHDRPGTGIETGTERNRIPGGRKVVLLVRRWLPHQIRSEGNARCLAAPSAPSPLHHRPPRGHTEKGGSFDPAPSSI